MADGSSWGQDSFVEPSPREPRRVRLFPLVEASRVEPPPTVTPKRTRPWATLPFLVMALALVALVHAVWLRVLLPLVLVAVAIGVLIRSRRAARTHADVRVATPSLRKSGRRSLPEVRGVVLELGDTPSVALASDRLGDLAKLSLLAPFGVVLLSNRRRDHLVAALTTHAGTFLVGARMDSEAKSTLADLVARACTHGGDDSALLAASPDGSPVCIAGDHFRELMNELERLDPDARGRVVVSDQRGEAVRLEGDDLLVRGTHFDLSRPIEWKPIMFQEQFGQAFTLFYQGTWIRQGTTEVVLVSLLSPSLLEATLDRTAVEAEVATIPIDVQAMRDQRLMQQAAADAPPIEQRVAIDGLFVVPIRAALDQAPRASSRRERTSYA